LGVAQGWYEAAPLALTGITVVFEVVQGWYGVAPLALTGIAAVFEVAQGWYGVAPLALGEDGREARAARTRRGGVGGEDVMVGRGCFHGCDGNLSFRELEI
jgi:hypothetical protein